MLEPGSLVSTAPHHRELLTPEDTKESPTCGRPKGKYRGFFSKTTLGLGQAFLNMQ